MSWSILHGDVTEQLRTVQTESVQVCITSPPYWALRDYGVAGQLGLEKTPQEYIEKMVGVFREVQRVLRKDGTLWLNIGDSYASSGGAGWQGKHTCRANRTHTQRQLLAKAGGGIKPKDLVGIPWMLAFALRADGWYLRSEIIWHKPNPMPESVLDRPTKAHEQIFLLTRLNEYFYNAEAIAEPASENTHARLARQDPDGGSTRANGGQRVDRPMKAVSPRFRKFSEEGGMAKAKESFATATAELVSHRNKRTVWTVGTKPFTEAHFATYPEALILPCILAGSARRDIVLDPFCGSGTTGVVALKHGRSFLGIELNPEYIEIAKRRIIGDAPLFNSQTEAAL